MPLYEQMKSLNKQYGSIVKLSGVFGRRPSVFLYDPEQCEKMYRLEGVWPMRIAIETMCKYRERNSKVYKGKLGLVGRLVIAFHYQSPYRSKDRRKLIKLFHYIYIYSFILYLVFVGFCFWS